MTPIQIIARHTAVEPHPSDTLTEIGIDQVARITLAMELEDELGIHLSDAELFMASTVGDLVRVVEGRVAA